MEILVKELRDALELLAPAVARQTTLPVLKNVLMEGTRARASDLEVVVSVDLGREVGDPFCIPHPQLYDLLKYTPGDTVITLTPGNMLGVKMRNGTASLATGKAEDYPPAPTIQEPKVAVLDGTALTKALGQIFPYTASEAGRPVLTAACVTLGDPVEVAAADGFRLAILRVPAKLGHLSGQKLLIPGHTIKVLAHLWEHTSTAPELQEEDGPAQMAIGKRLLRLEYNDKLARITFGKVTLITQLVEGSFPNYPSLVPTNPASTISFMAEEVRRAVDMLATTTKGKDITRLRWADGVLVLSAAVEEMGSISTQVDLASCTAPGMIAFEKRYLIQLLRGQSGIVSMETTTPSAPALFRAAGHPMVVVMPMFVNWDGVPTAAEPSGDGPAQEPASEPAPEAAQPPAVAKVRVAPAAKQRKSRKKA